MLGMNWNQWLSLFTQRRPARRPGQTRTHRLHLETLEDRLVPSGTSVVSGTVLQDQTGNGLSADDTALSNVKVVLYQDNNNDGKLDSGDAVVATQLTAADGSYSFGNLSAGRYFVAESTPSGFVRTAPTNASYLTINLSDSQTASGNVFDNFAKVNTGAITNISFTITDPNLGTYTVTNLRGNTHQGDTVTVNFTVTGTSPVLVSLVTYDAPGASFDASTAGQQVIVYEDSQLLSPGAQSLTVHLPDNFYQVDFVAGPAIDHLGPAGSNIFYSAQGRLFSADNEGTQAFVPATISGVAYNAANTTTTLQTLPGVLVTLTGINDLGQTVTVSTITDANGNYQFAGLREGTYTLTTGTYTGTDGTVYTPVDIGSIGVTNGSNQTINLPENPSSGGQVA